MTIDIIKGIFIPLIGTTIGSGAVFVLSKGMNQTMQRILTGFAGGVMVAASIWSLLIPAMDYSSHMGKMSFLPAAIGFWAGVLFLLFLDRHVPHMHLDNQCEGPECDIDNNLMMVLAVALHNLPEGMAIAAPVVYVTGSRWRAFLRSLLAGLAEPAGGIIAYLLLKDLLSAAFLNGVMPVVAGIMCQAAICELLPDAIKLSNIKHTIYGTIAGILMMSIGLFLF